MKRDIFTRPTELPLRIVTLRPFEPREKGDEKRKGPAMILGDASTYSESRVGDFSNENFLISSLLRRIARGIENVDVFSKERE